MHKSELIKQNLSLDGFMYQARRIVNIKAYALYFITNGVCMFFWGIGIMPWWVSMFISGLGVGYVYFTGADYMDEQVNVWVEKIMVISERRTLEDKIADQPNHQGPNQVNLTMTQNGSGHKFDVEISWFQIRDLIEASTYSHRLVRSSLSPSVWPNLTRDWKDGKIQQRARMMGLIDHNNIFTFSVGGHDNHGPPEDGEPEGAPFGVGG